jgi:DNA mismatch repair ATPase MutS
MSKASSSHMARISNCLQTILDLEPELERIELGKSLLEEFSVLKDFLQKIDTVDLSEDDVARVETATSNFLEELRLPLGKLRPTSAASRLQ